MTKKILLLASMALALVAFAVPAAAQAEIEFTNVPESGLVSASGEVTSDAGISTGPGAVTVTLKEVEGNEGTVDEIHISPVAGTHIPTNVPGCAATATAGTQGVVSLETPDVAVLSNLTFTNTYTGVNCEAFKIPESVSVDGTATATVVGGNCLDLEPLNDDLFVEVGGNTIPTLPVNLTGSLCLNGGVTID